jgi:hypothetical protein
MVVLLANGVVTYSTVALSCDDGTNGLDSYHKCSELGRAIA